MGLLFNIYYLTSIKLIPASTSALPRYKENDAYDQHRFTVDLSQLMICRSPPPLSFDSTFMKDAQCAEWNEKLTFRSLFFELS